MTSAYPTKLDDIVAKVREITATEGKIPARNRVMRECGVGAKKASDALDVVKGESLVSEETPAASVRRLHSVPSTDTVPATPENTDANTTQGALEPEAPAEFKTKEPANVVVDRDGTRTVYISTTSRQDEDTRIKADPPSSTMTSLAAKPVQSWPLWVIALGAFVSIWGGWVGLGEMTGFGPVRLLPGIADNFVINSAITLPLGVEAYAAYAMRVWLSGALIAAGARAFAKWSAIGSLVLGALGQVAYHLMKASGMTVAPWWITTFVSVLLVVVLGCAAALTHLLHDARTEVRA